MENKLKYQANNSQELEMISKRKNFQFILSIENYRIKSKKKLNYSQLYDLTH